MQGINDSNKARRGVKKIGHFKENSKLKKDPLDFSDTT